MIPGTGNHLISMFGAAAHLPPYHFVPIIYHIFAAIILGFGTLFVSRWQVVHVAHAFLVWMSVFNLFVVSIFWSVLVDIFRNEQGKRLFGFIAAGGMAGTLTGRALNAYLAGAVGPAALALAAAMPQAAGLPPDWWLWASDSQRLRVSCCRLSQAGPS